MARASPRARRAPSPHRGDRAHPSVSDIAGATVDKSLAGSEDAFVLAFAGPLETAWRNVWVPASAPPRAPTAAPRGARLLRRVALRRNARGARAEVVLRPGADAERVICQLTRRGKTVAVAARDVREQRATLRFRARSTLRAGSYTLLITVVDEAGLTATRRRRVKLT